LQSSHNYPTPKVGGNYYTVRMQGDEMFASRFTQNQGFRLRRIVLMALFFATLLVGAFLFTREASAQSPAGTVPTVPDIELAPFLSGFDNPVYLTNAGDGSGRIFIVERAGKVQVWMHSGVRSVPLLDIVGKVNSTCSECGLLGLAFAPDFATSGVFYVSYTAKENVAPPMEGEDESGNDTVIERYKVSSDPNIADYNSAETVLAVNQPFRNHNGGQIAFGPDDYLYVGMGDGGSGGDPYNNAQNMTRLLGKMLRIDVTGVPTYTIPPDNPFAGVDALSVTPNGAPVTPRPEIWALGLRNPWRWSFDRETGDLWIGDVGQGAWEEINFQPAASDGGENYGWRIMEGTHCYSPSTGCPTGGLTLPVTEYANTGGSAVTGGYVYRGPQTPLVGTYLFGDFGSGKIWGLVPNGTAWTERELLDTPYNIASFGEDEYGELYLVDYAGGIYRINSPDVERPFAQYAPTVHGVPEE